jgi:class 3 adenylate cyclase
MTQTPTTEATVLLVAIKDLDKLPSIISGDEMMHCCKETLSEAAAIIKSFGGLLAQETTCGLLASFGGSKFMPQHQQRASQCALEIQHSLMETNMEKQMIGALSLDVSISLASGKVCGQPLRVADRLQCLAQPGQVLVSASTFKAIKGEFSHARIIGLNLKRDVEEDEIYEIFARKNELIERRLKERVIC